MKTEQWKPVVGLESFYDVSDRGRIRSKHVIGRPAIDGILAQAANRKGYLRVHLSGMGKHFSIVVHRLVLEAFVGPQPSVIHETNHKNGVKNDNRVGNLEWVTPVENNAHSRVNGFWHSHKGEAHGMAKLKAINIPVIRSLQGVETATKLGHIYRVNPETIRGIWNRRLWKHIP